MKNNTLETMRSRGVKILNKNPYVWKLLKGATTAPCGFVWVWNVKSRFSGEYRAALVPIEAVII